MKEKICFTHIAYIDDAGDFGFPQGSELGCLVALMLTRREAVLARRRLRALAWQWVQQYKFQSLPELHCPSWLRDYEHETGLSLQDRHEMMEEFLSEAAQIQGRLVSIVLDKLDNQPVAVDGKVGVIVWHRLFEEILREGNFDSTDRIQWRVDGKKAPSTASGARKARETCLATCGVDPAVCSAPPIYVDSKREILIQVADAAVYLLYQAIFPAKAHADLNLSFDVSALDSLCVKSVQEDAVYVRLPPAQIKSTALKEERPKFGEPTRSITPIGSVPIIRQDSVLYTLSRPIAAVCQRLRRAWRDRNRH